MGAQESGLIPFDEYLAGEREVETRSEYIGGLIYAMAEASELSN